MNEETLMEKCLELAQKAQDAGETAVGSLVICDGVIVGEGSEAVGLEVTGHAEIIAIQQACQRLNTLDLSDCTLVTTAEPCWMCSYAIRETRISKVVIGTDSGKIGGLIGVFPRFIFRPQKKISVPQNRKAFSFNIQ